MGNLEIPPVLNINIPFPSHINNETNALDGTRETLVTLGVVVLQTNLELDGFDKVALLLAIGISKEFLDGAPHT